MRIDDTGKTGEREERSSATYLRESTIGDDRREEGEDRATAYKSERGEEA